MQPNIYIQNRYNYIAYKVLMAFIATFLCSRVLVLLIMLRILPDLYLYVGQTHVHHLNLGIFLLSFVGGYYLFTQKDLIPRSHIALIYGIGLGLTFDEFGMWFHLGGSYWQRASYDLIILISAILSLLTILPRIKKKEHWQFLGLTIILMGLLLWLTIKWVSYHDSDFILYLQQLELNGPK